MAEVPVGVKIISVLYYIYGAILVLAGIASFFGAGMMSGLAQSIPLLGILGAGLIAVIGVVLLVLGFVALAVGFGLWTAKSWARIVAIVLAILGAVMNLVSLVSMITIGSILSLIIQVVIAYYLIANKDVKKVFS